MAQFDKKHARSIQALTDILNQLEHETATLTSFGANRQTAASSQFAKRVYGRTLGTLNDNEMRSIYALLAYVAHNENMRQETVQAIVEANFNVNHVSKIKQRDYDEVVRFLVDLRVDELKSGIH